MRIYLLFALLLFPILHPSAQIPEALERPLKNLPNGGLLIDDFENNQSGTLPDGWYNRDVKRKANDPEEADLFKYVVRQEQGNKYLYYNDTEARHLNYPLKGRKNLDIYKTPVFSWKWRVDKIPVGADEMKDGKNDAAASVYVVFDMGRVALFKKVPKSIRYTWSSSLEKESEHSTFFGNQKIVVLESGNDEVGNGWITVERNIVEDYRRLFGDDPPSRPLAILILSDGDSMNENAIAGYDDLMFLPEK